MTIGERAGQPTLKPDIAKARLCEALGSTRCQALGISPLSDKFYDIVKKATDGVGLNLSKCRLCIYERGRAVKDGSEHCVEQELRGNGVYEGHIYETTLNGLIAVLQSKAAADGAIRFDAEGASKRLLSDVTAAVIAELGPKQNTEVKPWSAKR